MADQNNNQKYNDLGNQIKNSVIDAINSGDFSGLSDSVSQTVFTVLGDVGDSINKAAMQAKNGTTFTEGQYKYREQLRKAQETARKYHDEQEAQILRNKELRAEAINKAKQRIKFNDKGSISGPLMTILGVGSTFFSLFILMTLLVVISEIGASFGEMLAVLLMVAVSIVILCNGINKQRLLRKARKIKDLCGQKLYCSVEDIISATGSSKKQVIKDIRRILSKDFFAEGYIDDECSTFMASKSVYDEYLKAKRSREELERKEVEEASKVLNEEGFSPEASEKLSPDQIAEIKTMMTDGRAQIIRLHELNDEIPGEEISEKLFRTEALLNDIFDRVKEHPEQIRNCHKLMNYHLPTMIKLVEAYAEYDKVSVPGPEILKAKVEIEKTIDIINQAFAELLNRMFQDSVWDVTADAQVLKSMLSQEGLTKDFVVENMEG